MTCARTYAGVLFLIIFICCSSFSAVGQTFDDVTISYSNMHITESQYEDSTGEVQKFDTDYTRQNFQICVGIGQALFGVRYQRATKAPNVPAGENENGYMLLAGYDWIFAENFRLDSYARIGLSDTDPGNPLFATDTDIRTSLVTFTRTGMGYLGGKRFFPSAYLGLQYTKYKRAQLLWGGGLWWNHFGTYFSGYYAFNGVETILLPESVEGFEERYANIENRGMSVSLSYEFLGIEAHVKQHFALLNGGNDFVFGFKYILKFDK